MRTEPKTRHTSHVDGKEEVNVNNLNIFLNYLNTKVGLFKTAKIGCL